MKLSGSCSRLGGSVTLSGLTKATTACSQDRRWRVDVTASMLKTGYQGISVEHADAKGRVVEQVPRFEIDTAAGKPRSSAQGLVYVQSDRAGELDFSQARKHAPGRVLG